MKYIRSILQASVIVCVSCILAALADTPSRVIQVSGTLNYRKVVVPSARYDDVWDVNSSLQLVGTYLDKARRGCVEVFNQSAKVLRTACLETGLASAVVTSAVINDAGMVAGSYVDNGHDIDRRGGIFRYGPDGIVEVLQLPQEVRNFPNPKVTGITASGDHVGHFANGSGDPRLYESIAAVSFVAPIGQGIQLIIPPGSTGSLARGITGSTIFGSIRIPSVEGTGFEIFGWHYDTSTRMTTKLDPDHSDFWGLSSDGTYFTRQGPAGLFDPDGTSIKI